MSHESNEVVTYNERQVGGHTIGSAVTQRSFNQESVDLMPSGEFTGNIVTHKQQDAASKIWSILLSDSPHIVNIVRVRNTI